MFYDRFEKIVSVNEMGYGLTAALRKHSPDFFELIVFAILWLAQLFVHMCFFG